MDTSNERLDDEISPHTTGKSCTLNDNDEEQPCDNAQLEDNLSSTGNRNEYEPNAESPPNIADDHHNRDVYKRTWENQPGTNDTNEEVKIETPSEHLHPLD